MISLSFHNIKCNGCARLIIKRLSKINGISEVRVNIDTGEVSFDSISASATNQLIMSMDKMGYTEDQPSAVDSVKSYMSCAIGKMSKLNVA